MNAPTPITVPSGTLTLTCTKCTRYRTFRGSDVQAAGAEAERRGWVRRQGKVICARCPK